MTAQQHLNAKYDRRLIVVEGMTMTSSNWIPDVLNCFEEVQGLEEGFATAEEASLGLFRRNGRARRSHVPQDDRQLICDDTQIISLCQRFGCVCFVGKRLRCWSLEWLKWKARREEFGKLRFGSAVSSVVAYLSNLLNQLLFDCTITMEPVSDALKMRMR